MTVSKMPSPVSIVGPTAVGKTAFGLWLADRLLAEGVATGVDLISADSRQVYRGLDILSGADLPSDFECQRAADAGKSYWQKSESPVRFFGLSSIYPNQEWSVAHFQQLAQAVLAQNKLAGRMTMIIGGTGLYHAHINNQDPTLHIPPNELLREFLQTLSITELQQQLRDKDLSRLLGMNESDNQNPRRLIRALEVYEYQQHQASPVKKLDDTNSLSQSDFLTLGLSESLEHLEKNITLRVAQRFSEGALAEVQSLMIKYLSWNTPAFTATGVRELRRYVEGSITQSECLSLWATSEFQYAKRQLTWWKKQTNVLWISSEDDNWKELAYQRILKA